MTVEEMGEECMKYHQAALRIAQKEILGRYRGPSSPEDVVQDALLKAMECREQFDPDKGSLKSWFLRIVANCCHDAKRREHGRRPENRRTLVPLAQVGEEVPPPTIVEPVGGLSPRQRQVLALRGDGYSYAEIADHLEISQQTVEKHAKRARRKLRQAKEARW